MQKTSIQRAIKKVSKRSSPKPRTSASQLSLQIEREKQEDRNYAKGGRSFYFFDFDDNVAFLSTAIYLFHRETGEELAISSGEFAQASTWIGKKGPYQNYQVDVCDRKGSFRNFRDSDMGPLQKTFGKKQRFVEDVMHALSEEDFHWKGPSWDCFYHAVFNQRPLSVITARGHHPATIREGIEALVKHHHLPHRPNFLSVYPVSHRETRQLLGDSQLSESTAELKRRAIHESVKEAFRTYGYSPFHRFGMSDDDPVNIQRITTAMRELKKEFTENSFFVFDTSGQNLIKKEVFVDHEESEVCPEGQQLSLFDGFDEQQHKH